MPCVLKTKLLQLADLKRINDTRQGLQVFVFQEFEIGEKRSDVVWIMSDIIFPMSYVVFPASNVVLGVLGKCWPVFVL